MPWQDWWRLTRTQSGSPGGAFTSVSTEQISPAGQHAAGDINVDLSGPYLEVATAAGTPGTWADLKAKVANALASLGYGLQTPSAPAVFLGYNSVFPGGANQTLVGLAGSWNAITGCSVSVTGQAFLVIGRAEMAGNPGDALSIRIRDSSNTVWGAVFATTQGGQLMLNVFAVVDFGSVQTKTLFLDAMDATSVNAVVIFNNTGTSTDTGFIAIRIR